MNRIIFSILAAGSTAISAAAPAHAEPCAPQISYRARVQRERELRRIRWEAQRRHRRYGRDGGFDRDGRFDRYGRY